MKKHEQRMLELERLDKKMIKAEIIGGLIGGTAALIVFSWYLLAVGAI